MPSRNFYELLQVNPGASQAEIDASYRRLAKQYHPDVNKSPDAGYVMQELNIARATVCDPAKRAAYDQWLFGGVSTPVIAVWQNGTGSRPPQAPFACANCGRVDSTLRVSVFQYVISVIFTSFKRVGGAGIFCSECRNEKANYYTWLSILLGIWGIPYGIAWTIQAGWSNLAGGLQPPDANGPLLRALGTYFWSMGNKAEAINAFKASLGFQDNPQLRQILKDLQRRR